MTARGAIQSGMQHRETAKRTLFQGNAVASLDVPFRQRKGQFKTKNNVEDILFVLLKNTATLPAFAICPICLRWARKT